MLKNKFFTIFCIILVFIAFFCTTVNATSNCQFTYENNVYDLSYLVDNYNMKNFYLWWSDEGFFCIALTDNPDDYFVVDLLEDNSGYLRLNSGSNFIYLRHLNFDNNNVCTGFSWNGSVSCIRVYLYPDTLQHSSSFSTSNQNNICFTNHDGFFLKTPDTPVLFQMESPEEIPTAMVQVIQTILPIGLVIFSILLVISLMRLLIYRFL